MAWKQVILSAFLTGIFFAPLTESQAQVVTTVPGTEGLLDSPRSLLLDPSDNLYIADSGNRVVRRRTPDGTVERFAGVTSPQGSGIGDGGPASQAWLYDPAAITHDREGHLYITGAQNRIRVVNSDGTIGTRPGSERAGLAAPAGLVVNTAGSLFVADTGNSRVLRFDGENLSVVVSSGASLGRPTGLALDAAGNLYVADAGRGRILKVVFGTDPNGAVTVFAGEEADLFDPWGLAFDNEGNLYVADRGHHRIRRISPSGQVTTFAGTGSAGLSDEGTPAAEAAFRNPEGVAVGPDGTVYVADTGNNRVWQVAPVSWVYSAGSRGFGRAARVYRDGAGRADGESDAAPLGGEIGGVGERREGEGAVAAPPGREVVTDPSIGADGLPERRSPADAPRPPPPPAGSGWAWWERAVEALRARMEEGEP